MAFLHRMRNSATRRLAAVTIAVTAAVLAVAGTLTPALAATGPSMDVDGNDVNIAVQGANNSLLFYWAVNGTPGWNTETVAGAGTTFSAPSMAVDGNTVIIAAQGPNNSLMFYWAVNGSPTWHAETVAGAGTTFAAPSVATEEQHIEIAAVGPGNSLDSYYENNSFGPWTAEVVVPPNHGGLPFGSPVSAATVIAGDTVDIAVGTGDDALILYSQPVGGAVGSWGAQVLGDTNTTNSAPSIMVTGSTVNISTTFPGGGVLFYWAFLDSTAWHAEFVSRAGDYATATSIATDFSTNAAMIAAVGLDGHLEFFSAVYGTGTWSSELVSGAGTVSSSLAPVINADTFDGYNGVNISVVGSGGQVRFDFSAFRSGTWYGEAVPGNGTVGKL